MGRVKDHFWDEINARAENEPCEPDPDHLEMLALDAEQAQQRYLRALEEKQHERGR